MKNHLPTSSCQHSFEMPPYSSFHERWDFQLLQQGLNFFWCPCQLCWGISNSLIVLWKGRGEVTLVFLTLNALTISSAMLFFGIFWTLLESFGFLRFFRNSLEFFGIFLNHLKYLEIFWILFDSDNNLKLSKFFGASPHWQNTDVNWKQKSLVFHE